MRTILSVSICLFFCFPALAKKEAKKNTKPTESKLGFSVNKAEVEFLSVGQPGVVKIRGNSNGEGDFQGKFLIKDSRIIGLVKFKLDSLDTGIELRNSHMKEKYLETKKFPLTTLKMTELSMPADFFSGEEAKASDLPFSGMLELHGVSHAVNGTANCKRTNKELKWEFEFKIKVADFKISPPSYLGITMSQDVTTNVNFETTITKE